MATQAAAEECDHRFKLLLIGDSGVVSVPGFVTFLLRLKLHFHVD
jgi:hypothetical protein